MYADIGSLFNFNTFSATKETSQYQLYAGGIAIGAYSTPHCVFRPESMHMAQW